VATSKLTLEEREAGEVTILALSGQMLLDDGDLAFRRNIHDLLERGRKKILLELSGLTSIDSSGIGMIAAKLKTVRESGGDLKLLNLTARGQRAFGFAKLHLIFEAFDDEEIALKSFEPKGR
jgi:anti-sigma B factor antagonist